MTPPLLSVPFQDIYFEPYMSCLFLGTNIRPRRTIARARISGVNNGVSEDAILAFFRAPPRLFLAPNFRIAYSISPSGPIDQSPIPTHKSQIP